MGLTWLVQGALPVPARLADCNVFVEGTAPVIGELSPQYQIVIRCVPIGWSSIIPKLSRERKKKGKKNPN